MPEMKFIENGRGLLDIKQASQYLNLKVSTLYGLCMRREIPFVKIRRLNRFRQQDLDKWITEHIQEAV